MKAEPIIPGKAYRVHHGKIVVDVIASNACEAIIIVSSMRGMIVDYDINENIEDSSWNTLT
jgi:hypothetical protein